MTQIEKIKAEIERLKAEQVQYSDIYGSVDDYARASMCEGMVSTLSHLLSFIEALEKEQPQGLDEAKSKYWNYTGSGITDFATFKKAADFFYRQGCIDTEDKIRNAKPEDFGEISCQSAGLDEAAEKWVENNCFDCDCVGENRAWDAFKAGAEWMAGQGVAKEAVIGMATEEISINVSQKTLNELDLYPGDKVVFQIRKK